AAACRELDQAAAGTIAGRVELHVGSGPSGHRDLHRDPDPGTVACLVLGRDEANVRAVAIDERHTREVPPTEVAHEVACALVAVEIGGERDRLSLPAPPLAGALARDLAEVEEGVGGLPDRGEGARRRGAELVPLVLGIRRPLARAGLAEMRARPGT